MALAFFRNAFLGIVELMPSGNRVRHHDRTRTRNARHSNAQCNNILLVNPHFHPANADLAARGYQIGCTPEVYSSTNQAENASGAAMRMEKP